LQSVVEKVGNSIAAVCKEIDLKRRFRVTEPMTVQIDLDGDQVVGIRGLNASGTEAYNVSFKIRTRKTKALAAANIDHADGGDGNGGDGNGGEENGGDECYECPKGSLCPPSDYVEVPCT